MSMHFAVFLVLCQLGEMFVFLVFEIFGENNPGAF